MHDLSLKGVARQYAGTTGDFSVVNSIFGTSSIAGNESLRSKLESLAHTEHSFSASECIFGWVAGFEQTWSHMRIRILLNPDAGISAATVVNLRTTWGNGIEGLWNDHWACERSGELPCRLSFEVDWVAGAQHHTVRIRPGPGRSNMATWHTTDPGNIAAHEYGHMLGLVDEYSDPVCPYRSPVITGTVMDNNTNNVPARLMTRFASNIGSNVVSV